MKDGKNKHQAQDVTGEGIHTDGSNNTGIFCIEQNNTSGAETQFHHNLYGTQLLNEPSIFKGLSYWGISYWGQGVILKENKIYHSVSEMTEKIPESFARRTVLVINDSAQMFLLGRQNPNNRLKTKRSIKNVAHKMFQLKNAGMELTEKQESEVMENPQLNLSNSSIN